MEKIHPDLKDSVAETLFIPLAMRALDVRQKRPVLGDAYSARLMEKIDYPLLIQHLGLDAAEHEGLDEFFQHLPDRPVAVLRYLPVSGS